MRYKFLSEIRRKNQSDLKLVSYSGRLYSTLASKANNAVQIWEEIPLVDALLL